MLLDFTGGTLSVAQLLFDGWTTDHWKSVIGDPVKFGLGFCSMFFDIIFMIQVKRRTNTSQQSLRPYPTPAPLTSALHLVPGSV